MTPDELAALVDSYGSRLYGFCLRLAGNRADADDLFQETFLKAVRQRERISVRSNPEAYLASVAAFLWKSLRRRYARRQRLAPYADAAELDEQPDEYNGVEQAVLEKNMLCALRTAVSSLDDRFRIPLYMRYMLDLSIEEIAAALHIPAGTVKSRLHKARGLARTNMEAMGYEIP